MNPDYKGEMHRGERMPGSWTKPQAAPTAEYYDTSSSYYDAQYAGGGYQDGYHGSYEKKPSATDYDADRSAISGYDRFNGNQPVFPPIEDRQTLAGNDRKRPMHESASMYQAKFPRTTSSYSQSSFHRFNGNSSEILQEESRKCIAEMSQELAVLDNSQNPEFHFLAHTRRLLNEEINKITTDMNPDWLDVESNKSSVKVLKRVLLPRTRPGSNVVGRLMGVGGQTLRKLCQTYKCHISICGSGSRKDPKEEADLLSSRDPKYNHLACPLHAEVSTTGPPHLAYSRLGQILTLLHKIITVEERFEHDGLVFEMNTTGFRRREDGGEGEAEQYGDAEAGQHERRSNYRGRGRGRGSYNRGRSNSPNQSYQQQQSSNSWRNNGDGEPKADDTDFRNSPKTNNGRGRGRGSGRGGFVPRARTHQ